MLGFGRSSRSNRQELVSAVLEPLDRIEPVAPGPSGIPHVRFAVSFERARFPIFEAGPRVLALSSFTEFYAEPVETGAAA